jgi:hypothetical protein
MKTCQVHPLSITIGAISAALLLFACSSGGGGNSAPSPGPYQSPAASSLVSFYSDSPAFLAVGNSLFDLGTMGSQVVITDFSWESGREGKLLVNGAPVYGWGFGGRESSTQNGSAYGYATPPRFSLAHGIRIPAGASLAVEGTLGSYISLAGYRED